MLTRRSVLPPLLALLLVATALPARAADPPLGAAVTLADGTVLPPLPPEMLMPTAQAEMLAAHGGAEAMAGDVIDAPSLEPARTLDTVPMIAAGEIEAVPGPAGSLPNHLAREVLGFLPYWYLDDETIDALRFDLVSTIAYFSIGAQPNGYLARGPVDDRTIGWQGWTSSALSGVINAAHARGVRVVPTITMMAWNGDYADMRSLLTSSTYRGRLASEIVTIVRDRHADGVNLDFEPVPTDLRSAYTAFVRQVKAALVAAHVGSYVTVDTMAGAATWATGYDVDALTDSGAADALMVMAYDFSWSGSTRAGGVAPEASPYIFAAAEAMADYVAQAPASKIIWGIPYYGRAWNTTSSSLNSTVRSPATSVAFVYYGTDSEGPLGGKVLGATYGRKWDSTGKVPWVVWHASDGGYRQAYYDDPTSLGAKYSMVQRNGVAGIGIWALGMDTGVSDLWNVIRNRFVRTQSRLAGADRYATAAAVSADAFGTDVPVAYIATGATFPDALAAGPAAARAGGPILLTARSSIPAATRAELRRLDPKRIVVLGGTGVVSGSVADELEGFTTGAVTRIAGSNRYATAAAISSATFASGVPVAYVATGEDFPDALGGGAAAGRQKGPILLTTRDDLPASTAAELGRLRPTRIVVLGGASVISSAVAAELSAYATGGTVTRLAGSDRYDTAVAVSEATTAANTPRTVYIATGLEFPDGLAGAPAAARAGAPLLIAPGTWLPPGVADELRRLNPQRIVILGGTGVISNGLADQIAALWD